MKVCVRCFYPEGVSGCSQGLSEAKPLDRVPPEHPSRRGGRAHMPAEAPAPHSHINILQQNKLQGHGCRRHAVTFCVFLTD